MSSTLADSTGICIRARPRHRLTSRHAPRPSSGAAEMFSEGTSRDAAGNGRLRLADIDTGAELNGTITKHRGSWPLDQTRSVGHSTGCVPMDAASGSRRRPRVWLARNCLAQVVATFRQAGCAVAHCDGQRGRRSGLAHRRAHRFRQRAPRPESHGSGHRRSDCADRAPQPRCAARRAREKLRRTIAESEISASSPLISGATAEADRKTHCILRLPRPEHREPGASSGREVGICRSSA